MEMLAAIGGGAFVLVSWVLGVRLLALWLRTRQVPELACGLGLLLMGGVGYPLIALVQEAPLASRVKIALLAAQMLCHVVGATVFCVFTQRVFRPSESWAWLITGATFAAVMTGALVQIWSPGLLAYAEKGEGIWHWHGAASTLPLLWAGAESLRYHGLMRRRQQLGLADPLLTDRFRLWAVAMFAAALITIISITAESLGSSLAGTAFGGIVIGSLGSVSAGAIWLAFLPPAAYRRRLQRAA
jgi:hypothetical protein